MLTDRKKVLVTGGCGFIGANLVPMLQSRGYSVRILDNLSRGRTEYLENSDAEIHIGDIRDRDTVRVAVDGVGGVFHLAAYGSVVESVREPSENFDINVNGTFRVLEACRDEGVSKLVFASTGGALIGNAEPPVDEKSLPRPISPYGSSKLCGEAYCSSFAASYGMDITALRFANAYGAWSAHKQGAVTAFIKAVSDGAPITIFGDGSATRDFLFVEDLCHGIEAAYAAALGGYTTLHLASGREVSVAELASLICRAAGVEDHPIKYVEKRVGEVERNFADYGKAEELIGFSPEIELETGLKLTWDWFAKSTV